MKALSCPPTESIARAISAADLDLAGRSLAMTDCWVNVMPRHAAHGLHLHPISTISGTYYVRTPRGASHLKFEDPRLPSLMASPPRKADCRPENRTFVSYPVAAGHVIANASTAGALGLLGESHPQTARAAPITAIRPMALIKRDSYLTTQAPGIG